MADQPGTGDAPRRWSFGAAAFDERAMRLYVGGRAVELELKPLEVLRYLVRHAGEAVSKDDLVKAVWPGRVISDSALTSTIAKLREALGDEQDAISTVHGFGYRLDAAVRGDGGTGRNEGNSDSRASRRLTAIMFTDLVGYSALAHRDEPLALELLELHRGWVREILPPHGGREIETIGDAFLVEFSGALAAVECAVAIQRRFAAHNAVAPEGRRMQLRIGIHAGDVQHKDGKVMGDGVNIASRIHGLAEPGGICVSEDVQRAVRPHGYRLESLGTPSLKNIATPPQLYRVLLDDAPPPAARRRWMGAPPRWLAAAAAVVLAVGLAVAGYFSRAPRGEAPLPSVAVLPFDNLSGEADSVYFTDGLHDSVIGHLARIQGLKVISRTSVMGFRDKRPNLRDIARELGVDHIVEGSVQRAGGRLRVTAQLIDTASDSHLWSNEYDRELADVFAVQADIAKSVAAAVHAELTPQEQAAIDLVPTKNQAAYDLYLRALLLVGRSALLTADQIRQGVSWLDEAVALDPSFARAYALLAYLHNDAHWFGHDPSDERRRLVGANVEMALKLEPDLPEAHVAKAMHLYHGSLDYEAALRELEIAQGVAPGNASIHFWRGNVYRRQGRWEEATANYERAERLDPLNPFFLQIFAEHLMVLRRYDEADSAYQRVVRLDPESTSARLEAALARFRRTGDLAVWRQTLAQIPAEVDPDCLVSGDRARVAGLERRFDDALAAVEACKPSLVRAVGSQQVPREYRVALARWQGTGRPPPEAVKARTILENMLAARPDQASVRMRLAYTLVMLGDRERALKEADRALAAMPLSRDAFGGTMLLRTAAGLHANAGAEERALDELEQLIRMPAGVHVQELKLDPVWDPLRSNPRFQKLIADHSRDTASP